MEHNTDKGDVWNTDAIQINFKKDMVICSYP